MIGLITFLHSRLTDSWPKNFDLESLSGSVARTTNMWILSSDVQPCIIAIGLKTHNVSLSKTKNRVNNFMHLLVDEFLCCSKILHKTLYKHITRLDWLPCWKHNFLSRCSYRYLNPLRKIWITPITLIKCITRRLIPFHLIHRLWLLPMSFDSTRHVMFQYNKCRHNKYVSTNIIITN